MLDEQTGEVGPESGGATLGQLGAQEVTELAQVLVRGSQPFSGGETLPVVMDPGPDLVAGIFQGQGLGHGL